MKVFVFIGLICLSNTFDLTCSAPAPIVCPNLDVPLRQGSTTGSLSKVHRIGETDKVVTDTLSDNEEALSLMSSLPDQLQSESLPVVKDLPSASRPQVVTDNVHRPIKNLNVNSIYKKKEGLKHVNERFIQDLPLQKEELTYAAGSKVPPQVQHVQHLGLQIVDEGPEGAVQNAHTSLNNPDEITRLLSFK